MPQPEPGILGTPTRAGWSFVAEPVLGELVVPGVFVVDLAIDAGGFQLDDRLAPPSVVAQLIARVQEGNTRPVLVVPHGLIPGGIAADLLYGSLADAVAAPVIAADEPIEVADDGTLRTSSGFRQWWPRSALPADAARSTSIGSLVTGDAAPEPRPEPEPQPDPDPAPAPAAVAARDREAIVITVPAPPDLSEAVPVRLNGAHARVLDPAPWLAPWPTSVVAPEVERAPEMERVPVVQALPEPTIDRAGAVPISPLWIGMTPRPANDRAQLRRALKNGYDAHARAIARALAQQPGLLAGVSSRDLVTDLIALRAYHTDEREAVNEALRGHPSGERELLVARGAAEGLRRLPVVLGPVFTAATPAATYHPGDELIEPAFVDADVARGAAPQAGVELAIWSVSARRLNSIDTDNASIAVFPPGSRFLVLGVQRPASGALRVLLRDQADDRPIAGDLAARLLDRIGKAIAVPAKDGPGRLLPFAPGLDARGRRFTAPRRAASGPLPTVEGSLR